MALNKIKKDSITADAIDATKIADDAISEEHLDPTVISGHTELSAVSADDDVLLVFDTSAGTLKKIQRSNIALQAPTVSSISPSNATTGDGTGNHTIVITGTRFDATATASFINSSGTTINADTSTRDSATQITAVIAKSSLPNSGEPYDVKVANGNGLISTLDNSLNIDAQPVFTTTAGTLGTVDGGSAITTIDIIAADPDSAGAVTFEFQSGSLPAGLSSATVNENGVSKFRITGTPTNPASNTTTNFVLRAVDAASNTSSRSFSITVTRTFTSTSFTSSGTFAVPSGTSSLNSVLVVAGGGGGGYEGGGGGAGGLVFMPCHPVTPGGTITVTVGCGGGGSPSSGQSGSLAAAGQDSTFGSPGDPGLNPGGLVLTAKGGGGGGTKLHPCSTTGRRGRPGGSGGGVARDEPGTAGQATQPTQPGNSGSYGFGNPGGTTDATSGRSAGGGGGAGAAGQDAIPDGPSAPYPGSGGRGGVGKAYTIADGTTPVFYAGGGSGGSFWANAVSPSPCGTGGFGGTPTSGNHAGASGQANKGGGGGGAGNTPGQSSGGQGGKGLVIVRY